MADALAMEKICTALCEIDKAIHATTYLAMGGIALTLAIFLSSTITQTEFTHEVSTANKCPPVPDEKHKLEQKKAAMSMVLFSWWVSLGGFFVSLGIDVPNVVKEVGKEDLTQHANILEEFMRSDLMTQLDVGGSILILCVSAVALSYASWLMFPENRWILSKKNTNKAH